MISKDCLPGNMAAWVDESNYFLRDHSPLSLLPPSDFDRSNHPETGCASIVLAKEQKADGQEQTQEERNPNLPFGLVKPKCQHHAEDDREDQCRRHDRHQITKRPG